MEGEGDAAGVHALLDLDFDFEVFHGGVDVLFDGDGDAMNFIDEEHVAGLKLGEQADEVAGLGEGGPGGDGELGAHFIGDDVGEGGFAQAWWAVEQGVFHGVAALSCGGEGDAELSDDVRLADVVIELDGSQRRAGGAGGSIRLGVVSGLGLGRDDALGGHAIRVDDWCGGFGWTLVLAG